MWHPSLVYLDSSSRDYKVSKSLTCKIAVESDTSSEDFAAMLSEKITLEQKLAELQGMQGESASMDEIYSLKEKISRFEEVFLRTKNEYDTMSSELERVKADLSSLVSTEKSSINDIQTRTDLETQEKILIERIERRRRLLEQIHLL